MSAPHLAEIQTLLWTLITAPEGAEKGLARLTAPQRSLAAYVRGSTRLSAVERLEVYADMYFYRLRDCLKEDFGALSAVAGDDNFHNLITDYLLAHPPVHFSLRYAGQHLPDFVVGHPLSRQWPYLGNLATLEWAILEAFGAPDAVPLTVETVRSIPPASWPEITRGLRFARAV